MKIFPLTFLMQLADQRHRNHDRIALCHGCFDILTIGHIDHLRQARKFADCLFVTVTPDCFVNKGDGRPVFNEKTRARAVAELESVDYVAINTMPTAVDVIKEMRPLFYVKGHEYRDRLTPELKREAEAVASVCGRLIFTDAPEVHTTDILKRLDRICGESN